MSPLLISFLIFIAVVTAMISGTFGMAGGMILMAVLLLFLPVPAAMFLHACVQLASNGWRCFLWRRHIVWGTLPFYAAGMAFGFGVVAVVRFVPDKATALIVMGAFPLVALMLRRRLNLSILNRSHAFTGAVLLTFVQMTSGVTGPLLDLLYNNTPLTRHQIVATKAFTQSATHLLRLSYFGLLVPFLTGHASLPPEVPAAAICLFGLAAIAGTSLAAPILTRMQDVNFKKYSRVLIVIVSCYSILRGIYLAYAGSPA